VEKEQYIEQERFRLVSKVMRYIFALGILVTMLLSLVDYNDTPENFNRFLIYRLIASSIFFVLLILNECNKKWRKAYVLDLIVFIAGIAISTMVSAMIMHFGGHRSIYYVGMIVIVLFTTGCAPFLSFKKALLMTGIPFVIYLVPILLFDEITDLRIFIHNLIFLTICAAIVVVWRYFYDRLLSEKLSLEFDLSQEREQLRQHSQSLEEIVSERTKELRSLFENANEGIIILDREGNIIETNKKACEIHGFEENELTGANIINLKPKEWHETARARLEEVLKGIPLIFETENYRKDGSKVLLEVSATRIDLTDKTYVQSFLRDVTEKKKMQDQLLHSQKMESVGVLAGGVAHNFNNILTTILSYACSISDSGRIDRESRQKLQIIENATRKAGTIVSNLMNFAKGSGKEGTIFDLNNVIMDTLKMFDGVIRRNVILKNDLEEYLPFIGGDPDKIEQVLMNLLVNAKDALPNGGTITVKTSSISVKKAASSEPSVVKPGEYVVLSVGDTGCGIDKEIIEKIFDPFFTTKKKGKGSGLGLASVYGIVREHNGYIDVSSNIGEGTFFTIYFPVIKQPHLEINREEVPVDGTEHILLIDDDIDVLDVTKKILKEHGYHVTALYNSLNAIEIFKKHSEKIQLVVTDMAMPLVEGDEFIKIAKSIKPETKIIAISAYLQTPENLRPVDAFIQKPFENVHLLSTVRQVLDANRKEQSFLEDRQDSPDN
jgi:PAS domain S-box-containing protein